jgi:hypothetical protein
LTRLKYSTDEGFRVALEARVKAASKALGHLDPTRHRQLLLADRFLARVTAELGDAVVAKGGIALELRLPTARATQDLDLHVSGKTEQLLGRLQLAGRRDLGDRLRFEISTEPEDLRNIEGEGVVYQGQRFRITAMLGGRRYGDRFGLDVVFGGQISGDVDDLEGLDLLSFAGIAPGRYRLYPRELHVAEKLHAYTMPRPSPNGRVKNLPDLALLAQTGPFKQRALVAGIEATFRARKTHQVPTSLPPPPADFWVTAYARIARINRLPWTTLEDVLAAASAFINPVLIGQGSRWNPERWTWE